MKLAIAKLIIQLGFGLLFASLAISAFIDGKVVIGCLWLIICQLYNIEIELKRRKN